MTDRELMQMALDALDSLSGDEFLCEVAHHSKKDRHQAHEHCPVVKRYEAASETLRARLAQPEPEHSESWWKHEVSNAFANGYEKGRASVKREWQVLTDDEIRPMCGRAWVFDTVKQWAQIIEAKLKEKNNGTTTQES